MRLIPVLLPVFQLFVYPLYQFYINCRTDGLFHFLRARKTASRDACGIPKRGAIAGSLYYNIYFIYLLIFYGFYNIIEKRIYKVLGFSITFKYTTGQPVAMNSALEERIAQGTKEGLKFLERSSGTLPYFRKFFKGCNGLSRQRR